MIASLMKSKREDMMRSIFLITGAALTLAACGGGGGTEEANTMTSDNMLVNDGAMMDPTMNGDMNAMGNTTMDANTQNAAEQDLTTNEADTNVTNGM
jgi:hypothetical protein